MSSINPEAPFTGSPLIRLLRKLLHHDHELKDKEKKALNCLQNAKRHVPDDERREIEWIWPKGGLRTPWTSALEFFSLHRTGVEETILREYLATLSIALVQGQHPNVAITGNVPLVSQLVALDESGFTNKLLEHLRQEFPYVIETMIGPMLKGGGPNKVINGSDDQHKKEQLPETDSPCEKLRPCDERAYAQYRFAIEQEASLNSDKDVYDWLQKCKSINEDELPIYANWSRYLRKARKAKGEGKNTPRRGNPTKSVVSGDRVEYQRKKGYGEDDPDQ
jgi:hypothetical protein